jgi:hypothetical protein
LRIERNQSRSLVSILVKTNSVLDFMRSILQYVGTAQAI